MERFRYPQCIHLRSTTGTWSRLQHEWWALVSHEYRSRNGDVLVFGQNETGAYNTLRSLAIGHADLGALTSAQLQQP